MMHSICYIVSPLSINIVEMKIKYLYVEKLKKFQWGALTFSHDCTSTQAIMIKPFSS